MRNRVTQALTCAQEASGACFGLWQESGPVFSNDKAKMLAHGRFRDCRIAILNGLVHVQVMSENGCAGQPA